MGEDGVVLEADGRNGRGGLEMGHQLPGGGLTVRLTPMGYKGEQLLDALWKGVAVMVENDGRVTPCPPDPGDPSPR